MKKIKILKMSYWKNKIKNLILNICLLDLKIRKNKVITENIDKKILIITMDSLGDNIVKNKSIEIIANEYGKANIYILCKDKWKEVYKLQDYPNIFTDETTWNIFYKIKLYRKLNNMNFFKVIIFNHAELPNVVNYIYNKNKYDVSDKVEYILDKHVILLKKVLNKEYNLEQIKPNFENYIPKQKKNNSICIGIGASGNDRVIKKEAMRDILMELLSHYPQKNIVLLGNGKREKKYTKELIRNINNKKLINYVDKFNLIETIKYINNSDLFIGGDSGLMNVAFALNKKVICLHWSKDKYIWEHPFENVKIIKGKGGKKFRDEKYGTEILNSIKYEQIDRAINELEIC